MPSTPSTSNRRRRTLRSGDLVVPKVQWYIDRGIDAKGKMVGPMFWDVDSRQTAAVLWDTPGVIVSITPGGRRVRSIESPDGMDVHVLFEGRVYRCSEDLIAPLHPSK